MHPIHIPKKLIEVALPLDDINKACLYEKMPGIGAHPRGIHLWWARRPLAAARAVIFAQMVNDPGYEAGKGFRRGVNKKAAEIRREQLFDIIRELVQWENSNKPDVLKRANDAIWASWRETCELNKKHPQAATLFNPDILPAFHDPFAGGGALPLEAQRLGLAAYASDLNPVAVMINKAMLDIPPRFAGIRPIGPLPVGEQQSGMAQDWPGTSGLAETVRRYGHWMCDEAVKRIGHLYPTITITAEMCATRPDLKPLLGQELTVIAWLWARTVRSANPAYSHCQVAGVRFHSLQQSGQRSLRRTGNCGRQLPLHRQNGQTTGSGEKRHQSGTRRQFHLPALGQPAQSGTYSRRIQAKARRATPDGDRRRREKRPCLSVTNSRNGSDCPQCPTGLAAGYSDESGLPGLGLGTRLRHHAMVGAFYRPPTDGTIHLFRFGAGSERPHQRRCPRRWDDGRRHRFGTRRQWCDGFCRSSGGVFGVCSG